MASWKCDDCFISMDADGPEPEDCPKCGQPMTLFTRKNIRMFGGGGVADETAGEPQAGQPKTGR